MSSVSTTGSSPVSSTGVNVSQQANPAASLPSESATSPCSKRQKLQDPSDASVAVVDSKDGVLDTSLTTENAVVDKALEGEAPNITNESNSSTTYSDVVAMNLPKDSAWILGDVDGFGALGASPSMNAVLEKRSSSPSFPMGSSLLPSSSLSSAAVIAGSSTGVSSTMSGETENAAMDAAQAGLDGTDNHAGLLEATPAAAVVAGVVPPVTEGSGGNTKYMDPATGDYMYPENVKLMSFYDKQRLVQKITMLPSQYLRGLMDVISKYQPDTVRQIDDDGYAFDLGQMNENTVWAISDYVKDSMIELDGYIKSLNQTGISLSATDERQAGSTILTATSVVSVNTTARQLTETLALSTTKISAITSNESQHKFLEQVEMYSKPKATKSRAKPSKKHECPTCTKQFRGRSELQNHIRTHTGEKPLKCSYAGCTKRYAHSSNLRAHERTHAGIKPYTCHYDGCGKSFAHSVSLKEHIWMHAGFQPYVCPYEGCHKKFTQVSNFARHKKTHEKEDERREEQHDQAMESDT
uniref:CFZ1-like protein n=2 Tax=Hyaloperonospora TaxID=184462 RepID=M4BKM4_HYAAE|nr:CFZ1-like protein [Hyaloperonospora parasitica]